MTTIATLSGDFASDSCSTQTSYALLLVITPFTPPDTSNPIYEYLRTERSGYAAQDLNVAIAFNPAYTQRQP